MKRVSSKDVIPERGRKRPTGRRYGTKLGQPEYERVEPLADWVKAAVAAGLPNGKIANLIINPATGEPISTHTLRKYYGRELATGLDEANVVMSQSAFQQGVGAPGIPNPNYGNVDTRQYLYQNGKRFKNAAYGKVDKKQWLTPPVTPVPAMTIWWEKSRAGKKEGMTIEHTGEGQQIVHQTIIVLPANGRERGAIPILDLQPRALPPPERT